MEERAAMAARFSVVRVCSAAVREPVAYQVAQTASVADLRRSGAVVVLIEVFEVPVEADESFVAGWCREGSAKAALHRALRQDVAFRFVHVARGEAGEKTIADLSGEVPFAAHHPGLYEVVHQDGAPDGDEGVVLINPFAVPAEDDERFLAGWHAARDALAGRPGYLGTRLHRSLGAADFRFVNISRWSSPLAFARAIGQPEFREAAAALPFPSYPALYQVVRG